MNRKEFLDAVAGYAIYGLVVLVFAPVLILEKTIVARMKWQWNLFSLAVVEIAGWVGVIWLLRQ